LNNTAQALHKEAADQERVSEVLMVINENAMHRMRPNFELHRATIHHTGSTLKECGVPVDFYRTADLPELELSRYRVIVFLNAFCEDAEELQKILAKTRPDCHIVWNYAAGILNPKDGSFGLENIKKLTGFSLGEYPYGGIEEYAAPCYPVLYVKEETGITPLSQYSDGNVKSAKRTDTDGRTHIMNAHPISMSVERARAILEAAGVHCYAPAHCVVNADNRFLYLLSEKTQTVEVRFKHPTDCCNLFTGEQYKGVTTLTEEMEEGTCLFLKYQ